MTIRKLLLTLSIVLSCGLIIGGIVSAQEAPKTPEAKKAKKSQKAETAESLFDSDFDFKFDFGDFKFDDFKFADFKFDFDQDMPDWQGDRTFTMFLQGGTFLGVHAEDVSKENMSTYGMGDVRGVGVTDIVKDSPAEKAGLRKGDVILAFNGEPVTSTRKLHRLVSESSPDQTARLTISRGGSQQEVSVTLAKRNMTNIFNKEMREDIRQKIEKMKKDMPKIKNGDGTYIFSTNSYRRIGISTQSLTKQLAEYFGVSDGILVTSVVENSAAAKAGLKAGDIITAIDGEKVDSAGDITRAINKKQDGPVLLTLVRNRNTMSVTLTPEKPPAGSGADVRTIVVPEISIPAIPTINIRTPQIIVPAIPPVEVTIPARVGSRVIII